MATSEKLELAEQFLFKKAINEAIDTFKEIGKFTSIRLYSNFSYSLIAG